MIYFRFRFYSCLLGNSLRETFLVLWKKVCDSYRGVFRVNGVVSGSSLRIIRKGTDKTNTMANRIHLILLAAGAGITLFGILLMFAGHLYDAQVISALPDNSNQKRQSSFSGGTSGSSGQQSSGAAFSKDIVNQRTIY